MKASFNGPKGLLSALIAMLIVFISAVLYESGFINDELYLKLISAANAEASSSPVEVHFIDVDQAECILIKAPDKTVLIDAGDIGYENRIENHLRRYGVYSIDLFIMTHPHSDHMGSASKLFKKFPVKEVLLPEISEEHFPTTSLFEDFLNALSKKNCEVSYAKAGMSFELGEGAVLEILGNGSYSGDNLNNYSVVSKLTYGETSFLFTGDTEEEIEQELLNSGVDLSATVYNAAHHGSTTSNSAVFLRAVGAKYAAVSCGRNNDYGHPHKEILERFKDFDIKVYRTDYDGDIIFGSDGVKLTVKTEK